MAPPPLPEDALRTRVRISPPPPLRPVSKFPERDRAIVALVRQGVSREAIGERFGMSAANVTRIVINSQGQP